MIIMKLNDIQCLLLLVEISGLVLCKVSNSVECTVFLSPHKADRHWADWSNYHHIPPGSSRLHQRRVTIDCVPKWNPIPYIVHFFWPGPGWKVVHYIGNRVPFGPHSHTHGQGGEHSTLLFSHSRAARAESSLHITEESCGWLAQCVLYRRRSSKVIKKQPCLIMDTFCTVNRFRLKHLLMVVVVWCTVQSNMMFEMFLAF